ncbi:MAG: hypothetical protein US56_C0021G0001, partial [Candidatus Moranbacteria bacterium GW2011_GWF2_37_7]
VYLSSDFMDEKYFYFIPMLFVIAILGSFIGRKIVDKISQDKFRKLVLFAIFLISLKFIWDYLG